MNWWLIGLLHFDLMANECTDNWQMQYGSKYVQNYTVGGHLAIEMIDNSLGD
jgi:hypothetical protein